MARPRQPETMETISVRLPRAMVAEIDAYADRMRQQTPLLLINRADAVRQLLAEALQADGRKGGG
jgi:metal-responsive CopG/Arc/MetJ family transcriptional regulator